MTPKTSLRRTALAAALACAAPALLHAQTAAQSVTITGSNIKRVDAEGLAPVQTVTRADIERSAASTVGDLLRGLSVNSGASFNETAVNNQSGAAGVSLRGLGQKSTLVLINGRRMANHAFAQGNDTFVDINSIPKAAIERIEVLKDGASAIYGSDAIAGVVNFILKRDYQGGSVSASAGRSTEGGLGEQQATLSFGMGNLDQDKYNLLAVVDFFHRDRLLLSERKILGDGDFRSRPAGGLPWLSSSGGSWVLSPPVSGAARAPLNPCQGPSTQMPGNLFFTSGTVCGFTTTPFITAFPETDRLGLLTRGTFAFSSSTTAFAEFSLASNGSKWINQPQQFTNATSVLNAATGAPMVFSASIPAANPVNPFGRPTQLRYTFFDVGPRDIELQTDAWRALAGLTGSAGSWEWEAAAGTSQSKIKETTRNQVDAFALTRAINNASYNFAAPTAAQTAALRIQTDRDGASKLDFADAKATTTLGKLAGGPIGLALGVDARRESLTETPDRLVTGGSILGTGAGRIEGSRNVTAAFAEVSLPVLKALEFQLAVRGDRYSDFGNAVTPKVGLRWTPSEQVLLRASYNQGFRAPTLAENAQSSSSGFVNVSDPRRNNATTLVSGITVGNPKLDPEKSDAYTLGVVFEPAKDLSFGIDYFSIAQKNLVAANGFQYTVTNEALFPGAVVRDAAGVILTVSDGFANVSKVETSGVDVDLRWRLNAAGMGRITLRANASYIISWKQPAALRQPLSEWVNTNNGPAGALPRLRSSSGIDWDLGAVTTSLNARSVGSYRQRASAITSGAPAKVPGTTFFDLYVAYQGIKNLRLYASVQNLLDQQPPWDSTQALGFSQTQYDMRGRFARVGVEYKFK